MQTAIHLVAVILSWVFTVFLLMEIASFVLPDWLFFLPETEKNTTADANGAGSGSAHEARKQLPDTGPDVLPLPDEASFHRRLLLVCR